MTTSVLIAFWILETAYDGEAFFVRTPNRRRRPHNKLLRALRADISDVINHDGDEATNVLARAGLSVTAEAQ